LRLEPSSKRSAGRRARAEALRPLSITTASQEARSPPDSGRLESRMREDLQRIAARAPFDREETDGREIEYR
jgi:hypothetical protein